MKYSIPEFNMESLEKKLVRIQNKCKKYGCEFKYERVGEHFEEKCVIDELDEFNCAVRTHKEIVKYIDIDVEGVAAVNGWQFAASLEFTEQGNIIKGVEGIEIPKRYYDCSPWCEHCKTARERRKSFIVYKAETGEFKQVGKACLKDFTGGLSAEDVAHFESFIKEIEQASEFPSFGGFGKSYYDVKEFLVYVAEVIRLYGYTKNDGFNVSTAQRADEIYAYKMLKRRIGDSALARVRNAEDKGFDAKRPESVEKAKTVAEWITGNEKDDNYFHNLKVACSLDYCEAKVLGLLTSSFPAYDRELEREAERRAKEARLATEAEESKHVGEIGDRVTIENGEVICLTSWETQFGTTYVYKIVDKDNNVFTWKTSKIVWHDRVIEKITGTVKEHKEYRGVKQTELTRCKVVYGEKKEDKHEEKYVEDVVMKALEELDEYEKESEEFGKAV